MLSGPGESQTHFWVRCCLRLLVSPRHSHSRYLTRLNHFTLSHYGLLPPCLRFAVVVIFHLARLGTTHSMKSLRRQDYLLLPFRLGRFPASRLELSQRTLNKCTLYRTLCQFLSNTDQTAFDLASSPYGFFDRIVGTISLDSKIMPRRVRSMRFTPRATSLILSPMAQVPVRMAWTTTKTPPKKTPSIIRDGCSTVSFQTSLEKK